MPSRLRRVPALLLALFALSACGTLTVQEEKEMGAQAQAQLRRQLTFVRDSVTVTYVRKFGESLAGAARPSPFEFRFYVVEDESINAFAIPGGAMYVNTGLILAVSNSAELASVLSHEMGHVTARHVAKMARRGRNTGFVANIFYLIIGILTGNPYLANAGGLAGQVAGAAYMNTYTRDAEREADGLAVETMVHAGWNPEGMVTMFETLKRESGGFSGPQFLSSHPATDERIQNVRSDIAKYPGSDKLKLDDGKLEIIQQRLKLIIGVDRDDAPEDGDEGESDEP
jgi:predicted Zn-dependent protease